MNNCVFKDNMFQIPCPAMPEQTRRIRLRLSRRQREFQASVLRERGLDGEFHPNARLVAELAAALISARNVARDRPGVPLERMTLMEILRAIFRREPLFRVLQSAPLEMVVPVIEPVEVNPPLSHRKEPSDNKTG